MRPSRRTSRALRAYHLRQACFLVLISPSRSSPLVLLSPLIAHRATVALPAKIYMSCVKIGVGI